MNAPERVSDMERPGWGFEAYFWARVQKGAPDECWPWTEGQSTRGYGRVYIKGVGRQAHLVAWELQHGRPFPEGLVGCHTCDNRKCCNPGHIRPGTQLDNMLDASVKGRLEKRHKTPPAPASLRNAAKTHCIRGHPFSGENLRVRPDGGRACRECQIINARRANDRTKVKLAVAARASAALALIAEAEFRTSEAEARAVTAEAHLARLKEGLRWIAAYELCPVVARWALETLQALDGAK